MHVADVMTSNLVTIKPTDTLKTAIEAMGKNFRRLPVVDEQQRLIGIITDRDLRLAANSPFIMRERWQDEYLLTNTYVENCMTTNPATISPSTHITEAIDLLLKGRFSGLPVVDESHHIIGIVTITDLLKAFKTHLSIPNQP
jgi:acetoin utilization protein AcuB